MSGDCTLFAADDEVGFGVGVGVGVAAAVKLEASLSNAKHAVGPANEVTNGV